VKNILLLFVISMYGELDKEWQQHGQYNQQKDTFRWTIVAQLHCIDTGDYINIIMLILIRSLVWLVILKYTAENSTSMSGADPDIFNGMVTENLSICDENPWIWYDLENKLTTGGRGVFPPPSPWIRTCIWYDKLNMPSSFAPGMIESTTYCFKHLYLHLYLLPFS